MSRICSSLSGGELFEQITSEGYVMSEAEVKKAKRAKTGKLVGIVGATGGENRCSAS